MAMTAEALRRSASGEGPPPDGLVGPLLALWWQARGDWRRAHEHAQAEAGPDGDWVHAHLHRDEGDLANADYWYARAGQTRPDTPLVEEWHAIARALLQRGGGPGTAA
jgi:hypothetical protein